MRKTARHLFTLLICLLVGGCLEIHEELWITSDGAGRAEFRYRFPTRALNSMGGTEGLEATLRKIFDEQPGLRLDALEIAEIDGETSLQIKASTDSLSSLLEPTGSAPFEGLPDASVDFAGTFDVRMQGMQLDFSRRIDIKSALGFAALVINRRDREEREIRYIVHLPVAAEDHNATRTADDSRTLIWEFPLGEALKGPLTTEFRARFSLPWHWIALAIAALAVLVTTLLRWRRRSLARR